MGDGTLLSRQSCSCGWIGSHRCFTAIQVAGVGTVTTILALWSPSDDGQRLPHRICPLIGRLGSLLLQTLPSRPLPTAEIKVLGRSDSFQDSTGFAFTLASCSVPSMNSSSSRKFSLWACSGFPSRVSKPLAKLKACRERSRVSINRSNSSSEIMPASCAPHLSHTTFKVFPCASTMGGGRPACRLWRSPRLTHPPMRCLRRRLLRVHPSHVSPNRNYRSEPRAKFFPL